MSKHGQIKTEGNSAATGASTKGKRGRKKKDAELESKGENGAMKQELITDHMPVEKKKRKIDRFNGMPEEEVLLKTLPDRMAHNLDILIIGINPGLFAAYIGHHYAGPGNHFWKCLYLSGLVPQPMNCYDDIKVQQLGIGFTNIVARTSRGSADLKKKEIAEGGEILKEKLREYKPKIAVFNGKGIYEVFSGSKKIVFGKQPGLIEGTDTIAYVMPSSSARCSQLPRAVDKVPFYEALRRLRDYVVGRIPHLDESEVTFPTLELKTAVKKEVKTTEDGQTDGVGATGNGDQNCVGGKGSVTSQAGSGPQPAIKKEGTARGRGKGRGKKPGGTSEQRNEDGPAVADTGHVDENQRNMAEQDIGRTDTSHGQDSPLVVKEENHGHVSSYQVSTPSQFLPQLPINPLHYIPGANPSGSIIPTNPFSAGLTSLGSASFSTTTQPSSFPPAHSFSTSASQDFMSGFYAGSHPFGMVGFPGAVASQQSDRPMDGDQADREPVKIKAEPVD